MNSTNIQVVTPETKYINAVAHECTLGEFANDMRDEAKKYRGQQPNKKASYIDLFWHLGEYCDGKYGKCFHQTLDVEFMFQGSQDE